MPTNRHNNRRIQAVIYKLKRLYGGEIFLYRNGDPVTDLTTGVKTWTDRTVLRINRAIILPVTLTKEQIQSISLISSDKKFVYGGTHVRGARRFYVDRRDLPSGYEIESDDFIVYDDKQYQIKNLQDTEFDAMYEILGVAVEGVIPQRVHELSGKHILDFQQSAGE